MFILKLFKKVHKLVQPVTDLRRDRAGSHEALEEIPRQLLRGGNFQQVVEELAKSWKVDILQARGYRTDKEATNLQANHWTL